MENEWFENWFDSPYYHLLYKNRSNDEASQFAERLMHLLDPHPGETLLDLACGKGRYSIAFAGYGLDVTGVDLSPESITYAQQFENDLLHFYVHDMRSVFRTNYYDFVCNLFTSFGYFKNERDNRRAARSISAALKPGGKFLIDFVNRSHAIQNIEQKKAEVVTNGDVRFEINRSYTDSKFIKDILILDGATKIHFQESVNSFTLAQMVTLFQQAGLSYLAAFGSYQMENYDEQNSHRMILLFEK